MRSTRIYVRDCTLISPYPLLLFGGEIHVQHVEQVLSVDDRISYKAYAKTGVIFKELRRLLDELLATKLNNAAVDISSECLFKCSFTFNYLKCMLKHNNNLWCVKAYYVLVMYLNRNIIYLAGTS